jgi:alkyl hydroperoxide reductase subunit D
MDALKSLSESWPDSARDIRLNLQVVMQEGSHSPRVRFGIAVASAIASRANDLRDAILRDGRAHLDEAMIDDAQAAAALMSMNNVYYRFRHMMGKEVYQTLPARLRMNRIASPKTDKGTFELLCLAVSAIHGCQMCVQSHEASVIAHGMTEAQVHDAVRIAAVVHAAAVTLDSVTADKAEF